MIIHLKNKEMKKLILGIVLVFSVVLINAQTAKITITSEYRDASLENDSLMTRWVTDADLSPIRGTKEYYISSTWNPSNAELNEIRSNGGNTSDWELYFIINDTNFFYQPVWGMPGGDTMSIKSINNMPNKSWGEYLNQSHEMYYRSATNPDQYIFKAVDVSGNNLLDLNTVVKIKKHFSSYIPSYWTLPALNANQDKQQIKPDGTLE